MAIKKLKLNLKTILIKEAKNLITQYKRLLSSGRGVLHDDSPKKKSGKGKWLIDTGETKNKGFAFTARNKSFTIYALPTKHSKSKATYRQIFGWHNMAQGWSGVFNRLPQGSKMPERVVEEAGRQVYRWIKSNIKGGRFKIG